MELATNNLGSFSSHMISDSLSNPIWNFMDSFSDTKTEQVNNFDHAFYNDSLQQSDSDNEPKQDLNKPIENHGNVNGYEGLINYQVNPALNSQTCLDNDISQAVSMEAYDMSPNRFEWSSFTQPHSENMLTTFSTDSLASQISETAYQRRSSFPNNTLENLPEFPDLTHSRRRVVSWSDLDNAPINMEDMDLSLRRSSISIPLQRNKDIAFIDIMNQSDRKASVLSEEFHSPRSATFTDQTNSDTNTKPRDSKKSKANDSESQQTVVEKRLNRRRERNRLAARRSREKRTQFLHDLERVNQALQNENSQLKSKLCDVLRELEVLRNAASQC